MVFYSPGPRAGAEEKFGMCVVGVEGGANADGAGHAQCATCAVGWLCILYTRAAGLGRDTVGVFAQVFRIAFH